MADSKGRDNMQDLEYGKYVRTYGTTKKMYAVNQRDIDATHVATFKGKELMNIFGAHQRCIQFGRMSKGKQVICIKPFHSYKGGTRLSAYFQIANAEEAANAIAAGEAMKAQHAEELSTLDEEGNEKRADNVVRWNAMLEVKTDDVTGKQSVFLAPQLSPDDVLRPTKDGDLTSIFEYVDLMTDPATGDYVTDEKNIKQIKKMHKPCTYDDLQERDGCILRVRIASKHEMHRDKEKDEDGNTIPGYDYIGYKCWLYYCGIVPSSRQEQNDDYVSDDELGDEEREKLAAQLATATANDGSSSSGGASGGAGGSDADVDAVVTAAVTGKEEEEGGEGPEEEGEALPSPKKKAPKRAREEDDSEDEEDVATELPAGLAEDADDKKEKKRSRSRDSDGKRKKRKRHGV